MGIFVSTFSTSNWYKNNSEIYYAKSNFFRELKFEDKSIKKAKVEEYDFAKKEKVSMGVFEVTAYCPCEKCCGNWSKIRGSGPVHGASGELLIEGKSIAVDPSIIEYGTTVYINGKAYTASDCGVKGKKIDMYMNSHEEALEWGVKYFEVFYER